MLTNHYLARKQSGWSYSSLAVKHYKSKVIEGI